MNSRNESGMTLIEVLATLLLTGLIIGLIWTTVMISMKYNIAETKKTDLQKEGTYIISKLQQIHRSNDCYEFNLSPNSISANNCSGNSVFNEVISEGFIYSFETESVVEGEDNLTIKTEINATKRNLEISKLTIIDPENKLLSITIPVIITRYHTK